MKLEWKENPRKRVEKDQTYIAATVVSAGDPLWKIITDLLKSSSALKTRARARLRSGQPELTPDLL
jgi:hypothetical protein